ncbi:DUF4199 domain-containing protein [Persicobacter psychrovividus]|uniref:DUF4199 domain-containing protein n=1 Tax=Persicobacter psychrovividus TaxID=387638 RepID=A0ABM7VFX3_9BACT|nr:hypothetical protein PEPS_21350 [Persicobacter psychrovividus]
MQKESSAEQKKLMYDLGIQGGLLLAIISILSTVASNQLSNMTFKVVAGLTALVAAIVIYIVFNKKFKAQNQGYMSFKQGMTIGTIITAISTFISGIFSYIYPLYLDKGMWDRQIHSTIQTLQGYGLSEDQVDQAVQQIKNMKDPAFYATSVLQGMLWSFIFFIAILAIVCAIQKKQKTLLD